MDDLAVEAYYSPARTIGGDFGVVLPQGDELLSLIMCDVSGHGIGSALVANRIYSETLHELERKTKPGTFLRHLHDFVHDHIGSDGFYFTMAATRFARRGRHMIFAAAGHPLALLISKADYTSALFANHPVAGSAGLRIARDAGVIANQNPC